MIAYNHEKFIKNAIEGVLMQKTSYSFQLVIGEDCSNDATRIICEKYAEKYPNKIILLPSEKNLGMMPNFIRTLKACTGKYIALCEGDDYWIDTLKLQKQVDFLESHSNYSGCYHHVYRALSNNNFDISSKKIYKGCPLKKITIEDLLYNKYSLFHTSSFVFRSNLLEYPEWFNTMVSGDMSLFFIIAAKGPIGYIQNVMSVYREHEGGITKTSDHNEKLAINRIIMLKLINEHTNYKYTKIIHRTIKAFESGNPVKKSLTERIRNKIRK